ncbi:MAG: NAD(P)(+) transhydrogenase (Re/Si-specific) subunit alpha, partial [Euryarchaeota archaeon]|nr:NAD(P)(+) transhydrogenase (Re/Si-specific) subunit alpha [Euryarchaeota archaeon]
MKLGVLKEPSGENRVSIVPASVKKLIKAGFDVIVENNAGILSYHSDEEYQNVGAKISDK